MHVWMHKYPSMQKEFSPRKFLEIRYSETASEAILGQKLSRSSYMIWLAEYCIQFLAVHVCICYLEVKQDWELSVKEGICELTKCMSPAVPAAQYQLINQLCQ